MAITVNQSLSVVSTNATNNTAVLRYTVTCSVSGESYNAYTQTGTFKVDSGNFSNSYTLPKNSTTTVFNKDVTVENASGRTVTASYSFPTTPSGGTKTGSTTVAIPTLVSAPTINSFTVKSKSINSITCSFTCSKANTFYYKLSTASTWIRGSSGSITSGEFTISGLTPNTSYTIQFIARNWISESAGTYLDDTSNVTTTTYQIGQINSVGNFSHGDSTVVNITNPSGSDLSLVMKIGNAQIQSKTVSSGNNTISFSDTELDNIYKLYGSSNTLTATFILTTAGNYTNSKTCTVTLKGNQKTTYVGSNGRKRAKIYVGVNGTVKRAVVWIGNNGRKRCI